MRFARTGAIAGALLGCGILLVLLVAAWLRRAPAPGGNVEWLVAYAYLASAPLSLVTDAVQLRLDSTAARYLVILLAIPANWAAIGSVLGLLSSFLRPRG